MDNEVGTTKKLIWNVVVKGSIIYGLLVTLPARLIASAVMYTGSNLASSDLSPFAKEQLLQWAEPGYVLSQLVYHVGIGAIIGLMFFAFDRTRRRKDSPSSI